MRKKLAAPAEPLKVAEGSKPVVYLSMECSKGHREILESEANPLCSRCNYGQKLKPRLKCPKCQGQGRARFNNPKQCDRCWGDGYISPEFTEEEKA